jgi:hypothetical protein
VRIVCSEQPVTAELVSAVVFAQFVVYPRFLAFLRVHTGIRVVTQREYSKISGVEADVSPAFNAGIIFKKEFGSA